MASRVRIALAALVTTVACAGCAFGPGVAATGVSVHVTTGFGSIRVKTITDADASGSQSVMQVLKRSFHVVARGATVESIDGRAASGGHLAWSYYVNGTQATKPASSTKIHKGDRIWLDLHDQRATAATPAVVGSFPQPFLNGYNGQRYPTEVECGNGSTGVKAACRQVTEELTRYKIPASPAALGYGSGTDSIDVIVGTWAQIEGEVGPELIKFGPGASGVYAKFAAGGATLEVLDPAGDVARTLGSGTGLIAAVKSSQDAVPNWLVTGTDPAGVRAAARAFNATALDDRFALAVHNGTDYPLPIDGSS